MDWQGCNLQGCAGPRIYRLSGRLWIIQPGLGTSKGRWGRTGTITEKPLTYANHHVWQSWPEVDARRRAVGSAIHKLFQTKELGGYQLDTVGIWSKNCPSMSRATSVSNEMRVLTSTLMQTGSSSTLLVKHIIRSPLHCTIRWERTQLVRTTNPVASLSYLILFTEYVYASEVVRI